MCFLPFYKFSDWLAGGSVVKNSPAIAGDAGSFPGSGISPGEGNDNLLQHSCWENPTDRRAWWTTVHGVAEELITTLREKNNINSEAFHSQGRG